MPARGQPLRGCISATAGQGDAEGLWQCPRRGKSTHGRHRRQQQCCSPASTRASPAPRAQPRSGSRALLPGSSVPSARNGISTEPREPQRLGHGYSERRGPACSAPAPWRPAGTAEPTKNPTEPTANVQPPGPNSTRLNSWLQYVSTCSWKAGKETKSGFPPASGENPIPDVPSCCSGLCPLPFIRAELTLFYCCRTKLFFYSLLLAPVTRPTYLGVFGNTAQVPDLALASRAAHGHSNIHIPWLARKRLGSESTLHLPGVQKGLTAPSLSPTPAASFHGAAPADPARGLQVGNQQELVFSERNPRTAGSTAQRRREKKTQHQY